MTLVEKLQQARSNLELSMNQMAALVGVSAPTYKRMEQGETKTSSDVVTRLAQKTGINHDVWMNDELELPTVSLLEDYQDRAKTTPRSFAQQQSAYRAFIRKLINELDNGNQTEFANRVHLDAAHLSRMLSDTAGKPTKISEATMYKITLHTGRNEWMAERALPQLVDEQHEGRMLKQYLLSRNLKQKDLAGFLGESEALVSQYIKTAQLQERTWDKLTKALGVNRATIMGSEKGETSSTPTPPEKSLSDQATIRFIDDFEWVVIPFLPIRARAGFDNDQFWDESNLQDTIPVLRSQLKENYKNKNTVVIEINGDSMESTLFAGDKMTGYQVDKGDYYYTTGIVAVSFDDQFVVKRIAKNTIEETGTLTLVSDNPSGGSFVVPANRIKAIYKLHKIVGGERR